MSKKKDLPITKAASIFAGIHREKKHLSEAIYLMNNNDKSAAESEVKLFCDYVIKARKSTLKYDGLRARFVREYLDSFKELWEDVDYDYSN